MASILMHASYSSVLFSVAIVLICSWRNVVVDTDWTQIATQFFKMLCFVNKSC